LLEGCANCSGRRRRVRQTVPTEVAQNEIFAAAKGRKKVVSRQPAHESIEERLIKQVKHNVGLSLVCHSPSPSGEGMRCRYAATTLIRAIFRERSFFRIVMSTS